MKPPPQTEALKQVAAALGRAVKGSPAKPVLLGEGAGADARVRSGGWTFLVAWRSSGDVAAVGAAVRRLRRAMDSLGDRELAIVAVPFMGEAGERVCEEAGVGWLDLAGNAHLSARGLRVHLRGHPNPFSRRGRPASPFAPKSSRISRWLLMHPGDHVSQRNLARETDMDEGYTSRVVSRLEEMQLIDRNEVGAVRARDADLLLEAWAEDYRFEAHHIVRGHVAVRSGEELLEQVQVALRETGAQCAATGLAGAWLLTGFAAFRTTAFYVATIPTAKVLSSIGFHEGDKGSNLWWVVPRDSGVFHGVTEQRGVPCVHPVQVWLDLHAHPERSQEAADFLRNKLLQWEQTRD